MTGGSSKTQAGLRIQGEWRAKKLRGASTLKTGESAQGWGIGTERRDTRLVWGRGEKPEGVGAVSLKKGNCVPWGQELRAEKSVSDTLHKVKSLSRV